jgi:hypothetical protein
LLSEPAGVREIALKNPVHGLDPMAGDGSDLLPIQDILFGEKLLDRLEKRGTSGSAAAFLRLRDPFNLLVHRDDLQKVKAIWAKIGKIPNR